MKLEVDLQENFSRGQLLLRGIFGTFYILLPHCVVVIPLSLLSFIATFLAFWAILVTGRYPRGIFKLNLGFLAWTMRLNASLWNLVDGYPNFGFRDSHNVRTQCVFPESVSRGSVLLRGLLGYIIFLPQEVALYFRSLCTFVLTIMAFFVVLFTGKYPERWHLFNVGTLRWRARLLAYQTFMTSNYPSFSGKA
mgnify:CR=1 FL=1